VLLVTFLFLEINTIENLIKYFLKSGIAIGLISLFIGWLMFQAFEVIYKPRYHAYPFNLIREMRKDLKDAECFSAVDFILMDYMYIKYPGLADTIRGYWDHYYSNSIIGRAVPIASTLSFFILFFVEFKYNPEILIGPFDSGIRFIFMCILIIYIACLYCMLWEIQADRIFKEIEFHEKHLINRNIHKLGEIPLGTNDEEANGE
jgi:hypothetical protein